MQLLATIDPPLILVAQAQASQGAHWLHLAAHVEDSQLLLAQSPDVTNDGPGAKLTDSVGKAQDPRDEAGAAVRGCSCVFKGDCNKGDCAACNSHGEG